MLVSGVLARRRSLSFNGKRFVILKGVWYVVKDFVGDGAAEE